MTAVDIGSGFLPRFQEGTRVSGAGYEITEAPWGYVIRSTEPAPAGLVIAQGASWLVGIAALVAAVTVWLIPPGLFDGQVMVMRWGVTILSLALAGLMFWFASRGIETEFQIDTSRGEVREVVRNRAGRHSIVGRFGFDTVGSVFIDRAVSRRFGAGQSVLVLRIGNTAQVLPVVSGPESLLEPLRDRLGRDLVIRPRQAAVLMRSLAAA